MGMEEGRPGSISFKGVLFGDGLYDGARQC